MRYTRRPLGLLLLIVIVINGVTIYVITRSPRQASPIPDQGILEASRTLRLELGNSTLRFDNTSVPGGSHWPSLILRGRGLEEGHGQTSGMIDVAVSLTGETWQELQAVIKETEATMFPWKAAKVRRVDCRALFRRDEEEMERARFLEQNSTVAAMPDSTVASLASSCPSFKRMFTFIDWSFNEQERDFPIAYSLLVFKEAEQVLRLLQAIYRPQNYYCVHVDTKSDDNFRSAMSAIAACFPNVFLTPRSVDVRWGTFSVLEPELICMEELWRYRKWKYLINLTGQEFPLRTNYELVQILTAYRGANNLEGTIKRANKNRWENVGPPPRGITPVKGSVHVVVNRDFVDFVLHSKAASEFLNWTQKVRVPDEVFFSSLNHNPRLGIRGAYTGEPETHPTNYPFLTRFKNWGSFPFGYDCASKKRVRNICILSSGDLPLLKSRPELFANKFYAQESRVTLDCLAEDIFNRTRDQALGHADFNVSFYANMPFVKNQLTSSTFDKVS